MKTKLTSLRASPPKVAGRSNLYLGLLRRFAPRNDTAFTFIELLIALTIFSIMAASIYYTFNTGVKVWGRGDSIISDNQKLRVCFDTISLDMRNAVFYSGMEPEWSADTAYFATIVNTSKSGRPARELAEVTYHFDSTKGELSRRRFMFKEENEKKRAAEKVLLDDLGDFTFEYCYELPMSDGEYTWEDEWEFEDKIPRGVRIKLALKNEEENPPEAFIKTIFIPMGELGKEE